MLVSALVIRLRGFLNCRQMLAQFNEVKESVNPSKRVMARNVIGEIEGVEELVLRRCLTHHGAYLDRLLLLI